MITPQRRPLLTLHLAFVLLCSLWIGLIVGLGAVAAPGLPPEVNQRINQYAMPVLRTVAGLMMAVTMAVYFVRVRVIIRRLMLVRLVLTAMACGLTWLPERAIATVGMGLSVPDPMVHPTRFAWVLVGVAAASLAVTGMALFQPPGHRSQPGDLAGDL